MRGANEASTLFSAMFGVIDADSNDPLVVSARDFAKSREGFMQDLHQMGVPGFKSQSTDENGLVAALHEITIAKHVRNKYLHSERE